MKPMKISSILLSILLINTVQADPSHEDECAIWLCAPAGFAVPECSGAHSAMHWRIRHHKSPLPSFSSCSEDLDSEGGISYQEGYAAYIPEHKISKCVQYVTDYSRASTQGPTKKCVSYEYETIPEQYIQGTGCQHLGQGKTEPAGCTTTYHYITVQDANGIVGETYYFTY